MSPLLFLAAVVSGCASVSPYLSMTSDELFASARASFEDEEWDEAIDALERLTISFPSMDQAAEARLMLSKAFFNKGEYVTSAAEFVRFMDRYPTHRLVGEAALGTCESYAALSPNPQRDQSFTNQAISACSRVIIDYPNTPSAVSAGEVNDRMVEKLATRELQAADFYFRRGFYDSAILYLERVVEEYPDTRIAPAALYQMMEAYTKIGYDDDAEETRARLLDLYPDSEPAKRLANGA